MGSPTLKQLVLTKVDELDDNICTANKGNVISSAWEYASNTKINQEKHHPCNKNQLSHQLPAKRTKDQQFPKGGNDGYYF